MDIGAYRYISGSHPIGDYYVAGDGNDYLNFGGISDPFRTLDKAMSVADSTVHVDGGHYDSYYLNLKDQYIDLNQLFVYDQSSSHFLSYYTLNDTHIKNGYINLPGFVETVADASNVALNIIGSSSQIYGQDYKVEFGCLVWKTLGLDGFLATNDVLRVLFEGTLRLKAMNTLVLHGHYSNYDAERAIFVSPSGSDSTVLGGDGTNTGGNGSFQRPYRTINMALENSNPGDNIVAIAGEYPLFKGKDNRILTTAIDRTNVQDGTRRYLEDFFVPRNFNALLGTTYTDNPWNFTYSGSSFVSSGSGFLDFIYDGSNAVRADSSFSFFNDFDVYAELRNAIAPIRMKITSPDNTVGLSYHNGNYVNWVTTGGMTYSCYGTLNTDATVLGRAVIVEHIPLTNIHIRDKYVPLSYIPEDPGDISVNVVGGTPQNYGDDFILENAQIKWAGLGMDGELEIGEVLRIIYRDRTLSRPIRVNVSLEGQRFTIRVFDTVSSWRTILKRDMVGAYRGPWTATFYMDVPDSNLDVYLQLENEDLYALENNDFLRIDSGYTYFGRGFVSDFLAIADSFINSNIDKPYGNRTERKTLVLYKDKVVANFAATKTYGHVPFTAIFNNLSIGEPDSWFWNFGDGTSSSLQIPSHVYDSTGAYTVSLAISGPNGSNSITKTNYITVI